MTDTNVVTDDTSTTTTVLDDDLAALAAEVAHDPHPTELTTEPEPVALEGEITTAAPREVEQVEQVDIRDLTGKIALAETLKDLISERVDDLRAVAQVELQAMFKVTGAKSFGVEVEGLGQVGTVSIPTTSDSVTVIDTDAYAKWVEANHPTEVEYVVKVRDSFQKAHLKALAPNFDDNTAVDPNTGEVVPGVKAVKGGVPKSMSVRRTAKAELAEYLLNQDLTSLLGAHGQDAIEAGQ